MEHMWDTTWQEDVMIFGLFAVGVYSLVFFCYTLVMTVFASMGQYSWKGVIVFWIAFALAVVIAGMCQLWFGILFYIGASPVVTVVMIVIERNRKKKLRNISGDGQ